MSLKNGRGGNCYSLCCAKDAGGNRSEFINRCVGVLTADECVSLHSLTAGRVASDDNLLEGRVEMDIR